MKIQDIPIGYKFNHHLKGQGVIIAKTKRTLTAKFHGVTTKITYRHSDATFTPFDF